MIDAPNMIEQLKSGDEKTIRRIYEDHKNGFLLFASRYALDKEELIDIYQDAVIALIENAKKGKIDELKSSLTTYLFGIGKFMIFQRLKKKNKTIPSDELEHFELEYDDYSEDEINIQLILLRESLKKLGEQCLKVLTLFYYEEKKLDEIQTLLGYSNKDVLKSQKSRCLKQLKDFTKK
ncbi:RNA polymerase sigma factor [Flavobacterium filum]|uniref:RNA polymerase sigma factor n=1 Tax=Flavobacterium filum TaxID=370974 RepID=UPI0004797D25|nr:sigma-70 family RNA polymerase sigma factor [Flavobacterium filum]